MKVKKYLVSVSALNTGNYTEIDLHFDDSQDGHIYYPKALKFINSTNSTIKFLYLANDIEKSESITIPLWYEYLEIPSGTTIVDIPKTQYIRIKKTDGTAISDFEFYAYNFSTWQR